MFLNKGLTSLNVKVPINIHFWRKEITVNDQGWKSVPIGTNIKAKIYGNLHTFIIHPAPHTLHCGYNVLSRWSLLKRKFNV